MLNALDLFTWGAPDEVERRTRIRLSVAAYAYEIQHSPIMSDVEFDALAQKSDPQIITGRFDAWWKENFNTYTGSWIYSHPDLLGVAKIYHSFFK